MTAHGDRTPPGRRAELGDCCVVVEAAIFEDRGSARAVEPGLHMSTLAVDRESAAWLRDLRQNGEAHDDAVARLHALLLRVARGEASRRRAALPARALDEVEDLCDQAASDALMAVLAKLDAYRGTARFTTWACKFVILEISSALHLANCAACREDTDALAAAPRDLRNNEHAR